MQISEYLKTKQFTKVKNTSDRVKLLEGIMLELGIEKKYFKGLLFQTNQLMDREIMNCFDQARTFKKNPPALFRKLLKEKIAGLKPKPKTPLTNCYCDYCEYYRQNSFPQVK